MEGLGRVRRHAAARQRQRDVLNPASDGLRADEILGVFGKYDNSPTSSVGAKNQADRSVLSVRDAELRSSVWQETCGNLGPEFRC